MFDRFVDFLSSFQRGFTPLPVGQSEVEVFTSRTPTEVWIRKYNDGNLSVCSAGRPGFDYEVIPNGFVIYANVKTDGLILEWFVWFD